MYTFILFNFLKYMCSFIWWEQDFTQRKCVCVCVRMHSTEMTECSNRLFPYCTYLSVLSHIGRCTHTGRGSWAEVCEQQFLRCLFSVCFFLLSHCKRPAEGGGLISHSCTEGQTNINETEHQLWKTHFPFYEVRAVLGARPEKVWRLWSGVCVAFVYVFRRGRGFRRPIASQNWACVAL